MLQNKNTKIDICAPAKIALSIAHSMYKVGAKFNSINEYHWSVSVSLSLKELLKKNSFEVTIFDKSVLMQNAKDYSKAYNENIKLINKWKPDITLEIHLNAADYSTLQDKPIPDSFANYGEYLYFGKSKIFAEKIEAEFKNSFEKIRQQIRPLKKGDNGYTFVKDVNGCCVLAEPFFINNKKHFEVLSSKQDEVVRCFNNAIEAYTYNHI